MGEAIINAGLENMLNDVPVEIDKRIGALVDITSMSAARVGTTAPKTTYLVKPLEGQDFRVDL